MLGLYTIPGDPTHAALVTKDGIIRRADISDDRVGTTVFLDIKEKIIVPRGGEEGLLGLAFAPDYPASGRFYVYYSVGEPRRSRISRFVAHGDAADPASERVILEIEEPYANHNGGAMSFGPDGYLYIGVGDGGSADDPKGYGQSLETRHGKILRIDVSGDGYASPPDNPFVGRDGADEILRTASATPGASRFDRATGALWAGRRRPGPLGGGRPSRQGRQLRLEHDGGPALLRAALRLRHEGPAPPARRIHSRPGLRR